MNVLDRQPGRMSDAELSAAIKQMIEAGEPESLRLDYKETLNLSTPKQRAELAKDVSSFANEQGGTLIYGVPEVSDGDLPRPAPLSECGMPIHDGLPEQVENILLSAIQPVLHAITIRVVDIEETKPKRLLVIHHPESYWKPHMVEGYANGRFYRRGNYRAIPMSEREVEAAYTAREASRMHARDFLATASFGNHTGRVLKAVACPVVKGQFKEMLLQPGIKAWLNDNGPFPMNRSPYHEQIPFLDGWRFLSSDKGNVAGSFYEARLFHNGATCLNMDGHSCVFGEFFALSEIGDDLTDLFLRYSGRVFKALGIDGPVIIQVSLLGARGLGCVRNDDEFRSLMAGRERIKNGEPARFRGGYYRTLEELENRYQESDDITFEEESSVADILDQPENLTNRLVSRLASAFGIWG